MRRFHVLGDSGEELGDSFIPEPPRRSVQIPWPQIDIADKTGTISCTFFGKASAPSSLRREVALRRGATTVLLCAASAEFTGKCLLGGDFVFRKLHVVLQPLL